MPKKEPAKKPAAEKKAPAKKATSRATPARKPAARRTKAVPQPTHEDIAFRAYVLSLDGHGDELANWLRAERELLAA